MACPDGIEGCNIKHAGQAPDRLTLEGKDNYGKPRQNFADRLAAASDEEYLKIAEEYIWLSAYASNNPRSDYHWMCDASYAEAKRRGRPELYDQAHKNASGG
jgi:hypothetical protein